MENRLGNLEELVLMMLILVKEEAYGVSVREAYLKHVRTGNITQCHSYGTSQTGKKRASLPLKWEGLHRIGEGGGKDCIR